MRDTVNLGSDERAGRLQGALLFLGFALAMMMVLAELSVAIPWWGTLAVPLLFVSTLIVQAYTGVCPSHASKGTRTTTAGDEPVLDPKARCTLEARGRYVLGMSIVLWLITTSIVMGFAAIRS
ncbi:MAG: hypothetical protein ABI867_19800 [Kofleriaceae bacterium]